MDMVNINMTVPKELALWLNNTDESKIFERNAMMIYPYVKDMVISYGRAAEILGISKTELIDFYGKMGIAYLNQSAGDLEKELSVFRKFKESAE